MSEPRLVGSLIFHKQYEKLHWLGVARILRDDVDVTGRFVKRLTSSQCHRFLTSSLARVADLTALLQMPTILCHLESELWYRMTPMNVSTSIKLPYSWRDRHVLSIGRSGSGKTN